MTEEKNSKLESRSIYIIQSEEQREENSGGMGRSRNSKKALKVNAREIKCHNTNEECMWWDREPQSLKIS